MNQLFDRITSWIFPRKTSRTRILARAYWLFACTLLILYVALFGISPIISWIRHNYLGGSGELNVTTDTIIATLTILAFIYLSSANAIIRERTGALAIQFIYFSFEIPSRIAHGIVSAKKYTRALSFIFLIAGSACAFIAYQESVNFREKEQAHKNIVSQIKLFIEKEPFSPRSRRTWSTITKSHCTLKADNWHTSQTKSCSDHMIEALDLAFGVSELCNEANEDLETDLDDIPVTTQGDEDFIESLEKATNFLSSEGAAQNSPPCSPENEYYGYYLTLRGRAHLALSRQGRVVAQTFKAHEMFFDANKFFSHRTEDPKQLGAIENGLGNIYANYISNYDDIIRGSHWPNVEEPPEHSSRTDRETSPTLSQIIDQAMFHLRQGRDLARVIDPDFANARFKNNVSDLIFRLLKRKHLHNSETDTKWILSPTLSSEILDALSDPKEWIETTKLELLDSLESSSVLEALITTAQLEAIELQIRREGKNPNAEKESKTHPSYPWLNPVSALQSAFLMGFRNKDFYEHPNYMGTCPLFQAEEYKDSYIELTRVVAPGSVDRIIQRCSLEQEIEQLNPGETNE